MPAKAEHWPEVVAVNTERSDFRSEMTWGGQHFQVRLKKAGPVTVVYLKIQGGSEPRQQICFTCKLCQQLRLISLIKIQ